MSRAVWSGPVLAAALVAAAAGSARALDTGMWDVARPQLGGCAGCHGSTNDLPPQARVLPILEIDGLPEAYDPGAVYELTVIVVGPIVPFAGFNLEATGGVLRRGSLGLPAEGASQIGRVVDECLALRNDGHCVVCAPGDDACVPSPCEVLVDDACPTYGPEYPGCACPEDSLGDSEVCRPCDRDTIVSIQATHSESALVPVWRLEWTAPTCAFGPVLFYLTGNSTNGTLANDPADVPGIWTEPRVAVPEC